MHRRSNCDFFTSLGDPKPIFRINLFKTKETPEPVYKIILKMLHTNVSLNCETILRNKLLPENLLYQKVKTFSKENNV